MLTKGLLALYAADSEILIISNIIIRIDFIREPLIKA
jgi:hypothetical protein